MAVLDVITYGHPTLRQRAQAYVPGELDSRFIQDMLETMYEKDGVGLAAPQVNVSKRLIVLTDFEKEYVLVNPEIVARSEQIENDGEGCLSLPGYQGKVDRAVKVVVRALDREGRPVEMTARGFLARVLQHEIDHLNGILYIDRAAPGSLVRLAETDDDEVIPVELGDIQTFFSQTDHLNRQDISFERLEELD